MFTTLSTGTARASAIPDLKISSNVDFSSSPCTRISTSIVPATLTTRPAPVVAVVLVADVVVVVTMVVVVERVVADIVGTISIAVFVVVVVIRVAASVVVVTCVVGDTSSR
jgi:hypothetical protein